MDARGEVRGEQVTVINVKTTAALLREALSAAWPTVAFRVHVAEGLRDGWISLTWEDGPTVSAVEALCRRHEGQVFDDVEGGRRYSSALVAFAGERLPRLVRFSCVGVTCDRRIGREGYAFVAALINAVAPGAAQLRRDRPGLEPAWLSDVVTARLQLPPVAAIETVAQLLHSDSDFTRARPAAPTRQLGANRRSAGRRSGPRGI